MMRLDKFLSVTATASRKESAVLLKKGRVKVNGQPVFKGETKIDEEKDTVTLDGEPILFQKNRYILLHKPQGYVSSTDDPSGPTVLELLPEKERRNLFPCGRLDKNTTGLLILTDDGPLAHRLLSPKHHAKKEYYFTCQRKITAQDVADLEGGVDIGGYITKPCKITLFDDFSGSITLTEGKYHQIKLMFAARCNKILTLHRHAFGGIVLDPALKQGEWRYLTPEEVNLLESHE
ncbi:MAG: rRNA pseudouridine synthase [Clostridia bacterium]|nr:rRNA pseudouridine synthase [Clostridia bacterium]